MVSGLKKQVYADGFIGKIKYSLFSNNFYAYDAKLLKLVVRNIKYVFFLKTDLQGEFYPKQISKSIRTVIEYSQSSILMEIKFIPDKNELVCKLSHQVMKLALRLIEQKYVANED